jgi:hypothetical protein
VPNALYPVHGVRRKGKGAAQSLLVDQGHLYQAEIQGQTITWVVPYQFSQSVLFLF